MGEASLPLLAAVWLMATPVVAWLRADVAAGDPVDTGVEVASRDPAGGWPEVVQAVSGLVDRVMEAPTRQLVIAESDSYGLPVGHRTARHQPGHQPGHAGEPGGPAHLPRRQLQRTAVGRSDRRLPARRRGRSARSRGRDRFELDGRADGTDPVEIVAVFEPADRTDPLWMGDTLLRDGVTASASFTEIGPFLADPESFATLPKTGSYR